LAFYNVIFYSWAIWRNVDIYTNIRNNANLFFSPSIVVFRFIRDRFSSMSWNFRLHTHDDGLKEEGKEKKKPSSI
jgi:hypothetical protein